MANDDYRAAPFGSAARGWGAGSASASRTEGVLGRRFVAYLIDLVVIALFAAVLWLLIAIIGLVTFGLGWVMFAVLPFSGVIYSAVTVGGPRQATVGMRVVGVRAVDAAAGGPVDLVTAAVHALLFYVAAGTLLLLLIDVLIGLGRSDGRMGHDVLTGVMLVRD